MLVAGSFVFRLSALMTALCTCVVEFVVVLAYYHAAPVRSIEAGLCANLTMWSVFLILSLVRPNFRTRVSRHGTYCGSSRFPRIDLTSGALPIRRLAIRRVLIESAEFKSLEIQPLTVTRFRAAEITTSDSLKPPRSNVDRDIS